VYAHTGSDEIARLLAYACGSGESLREPSMHQSPHEAAFPSLSPDEMDFIRGHARRQTFADGEVVFRAGQADIDFFVVESGAIEIINPTADNATVVVHQPGEFAGDIDMLTRRPVIVTAVARGYETAVLRVPGG